MIDQTRSLLKDLSGGELQQLAANLLPRINSKYKDLVSSGAVEGTSKTRKGTPDSWILETSKRLICIEVTTYKNKKKLCYDFKKNLSYFRSIKTKRKEYVCFINYEPQLPEQIKLERLCTNNHFRLELFRNEIISKALDKVEYHDLRKRFLGIAPAVNVLLTLKEFQAHLRHRATKLPVSEIFIGRDKELNIAIEALRSSTRILIIDGDPGVGKTRFTSEIAERISSRVLGKSSNVLFLSNISGPLNNAITNELIGKKNNCIIIDDANRIEYLSELFELLISPKVNLGLRLILTVRNYALESILLELKRKQVDIFKRITLSTLSNADIDQIVQGEPYFITGEYYRRQVVTIAKGNPRVASIVAKIIISGGVTGGADPNELFSNYFESVFSEINDLLNSSHDKRLLAIIAALRYIQPLDENIISEISEYISIADRIEFDESLARLIGSEVVDSTANRDSIRVFDDSISEYLVFRFFFHEKHKFMNFIDLLSKFQNKYAKRILENLIAISQKGYQSRILEATLIELTEYIHSNLAGNNHSSVKVVYLEWLYQYCAAIPVKSFEVVRDYLQSNQRDIVSPDELLHIIKIVQRTMYRDHATVLPQAIQLLRLIALGQYSRNEQVIQQSSTGLVEVFKYNPPIKKDDKYNYWHYGQQEIVLGEIEKFLTNEYMNENEMSLYVRLLSQLTMHHFDSSYMDYIDSMKMIFASGALHLIPSLKTIREQTFEHLVFIYEKARVIPNIQLEIIKAFRNPLIRILNFGQSPSQELMKFDAEIIISKMSRIANSATNFLILDKLCELLDDLEEVLGDQRANNIRNTIQTEELVIFQKFIGTYWEWREYKSGDYKAVFEEKKVYAKQYVSQMNLSNLEDKITELISIKEQSSLENKPLQLMEFIFQEIGGLEDKPLIEAFLKIVEPVEHSLFQYLRDFIIALRFINKEEFYSLAETWLNEAIIDKMRILASAYCWYTEDPATHKDLSIAERIINFKDERIDWNIANSLPWFERTNSEWTTQQILILSDRVPERTYTEILGHLEPSNGNHNYQLNIWKSNPEIFKKLVFNTSKFYSMREPMFAHHLSNCLKELYLNDPNSLFEYFNLRMKIFESLVETNDYSYEVFPKYSIDVRFVIHYPGYEMFLDKILNAALLQNDPMCSWLELIDDLYGRDSFIESDDEEKHLDAGSMKVFEKWLKGEKDQRQLIFTLLKNMKLWKSWFDLIRVFVIYNQNRQDWSRLFANFYTGSHSGGFPASLRKRAEMVRRQKNNDDSTQMKQFLAEAEAFLLNMAKQEEEREKIERKYLLNN